MSRLVQQNAKRFAHIEAPLHMSIGKLPPLKTPRNHSIIEAHGMIAKNVVAVNRRTKSLARQRPPQNEPTAQANVNFTFTKQAATKNSQRFNSVQNSKKQTKVGLNMGDTSQGSNMRNTQKRNVKRSFRPKASSIMGLEIDGPISMNQTQSTQGNRVEIMPQGREITNLISSIDNSSVENNAMEAKLEGYSKGKADDN